MVYLVVGGNYSTNRVYSKVLPEADFPYSRWAFTDRGTSEQHLDPRYTRPNGSTINRPKAFNQILSNGESIKLALIFMEDDGGDASRTARELSSKVQAASNSSNWKVAAGVFAAQVVAKAYDFFNEDDVLGVIYITVRNNQGAITWSWEMGTNCSDGAEGENGLPWGKKWILSTSGWRYNTYWHIMVDNPEG